MELTGVGSGVMFALAAALWLVYLVPSWLRSREYVATERNALRLQQTLRVLAETAEAPQAIRAETTARSVAEHQRQLRLEHRQRTLAARSLAAQGRARSAPSAAVRLRRSRAATTLVLLVSVVAAVAGVVVSGIPLVVFGLIAFFSSLAMLSKLASVARTRAASTVVQTPVARRVAMSPRATDAAPSRAAQWTPVPIPKPLYLSRAQAPAAPVAPSRAAADLDRAARASELALRAAQAAPEVTDIPVRTAPSKFAAMGLVDEAQLGSTDLNEVLRRRRA